MIKPLLLLTAFLCSVAASAQHYNLVLKKRYKTIDQFWDSTMIAFQLKDNTWEYGRVIRIEKDSLFMKPLMIQYHGLTADTLPSFVTGFALKNIYAFPKPGIVVDYNLGHFRINKKSNHSQALWLKNGYILRAGALGFAALNIINSATHNELSIENNGLPLAIAAAVLATGIVLDKTYKPKYVVGKKYHIELMDISAN